MSWAQVEGTIERVALEDLELAPNPRKHISHDSIQSLAASAVAPPCFASKALDLKRLVPSLTVMRQDRHADLAARRAIEDQLVELGEERAALTQDDSWNRERIRRVVGPAREAGIKVRDIARLTGLSTQTLHSWMMDLMRPIPDIHLALAGPTPTTLEQSVLRTIGEEPPNYEWQAKAVHARIPSGWSTGTVEEVDRALEQLVRWHMIWDGETGYRVAPPDDIAARGAASGPDRPTRG